MIELDKRIIEGKKPLTCFDAEQARNFVGKKCYLTNDISLFSDLDSFKETEGCSDAPYVGVIDRLTNINKELSMVFDTTFLCWKFCIPCEWVKEEKKEPKYRPYTLAEWIEQHEIGEVIHYRDKDYKQEFCVMYSGYIIDDGEDVQDVRTIGRIVLMFTGYFLEELFKDYEIEMNDEWQPFGVIDE